MADGFISMLLDRLASTTYEYVDGEEKLVLNTKKDIEEFVRNLEAIQAILEDAEQRQFKEASVRIWLDQLKDISFQMVDVLDKWNTDMLRQLVEKQEREGENALVPNRKKKVTPSVFPSCFCFHKAEEVIFLHDIASKIKGLNDKLSVIDEQRKRFEFQHIERCIQEFPERQKTPSFAVMSEVLGREKEKDILITKLLSDGGEDRRGLHIICASDPFDETKIVKSISGDGAPSSNKLDHVSFDQVKIPDKIFMKPLSMVHPILSCMYSFIKSYFFPTREEKCCSEIYECYYLDQEWCIA